LKKRHSKTTTMMNDVVIVKTVYDCIFLSFLSKKNMKMLCDVYIPAAPGLMGVFVVRRMPAETSLLIFAMISGFWR